MEVKTMLSEKGRTLLVLDNYKFTQANISKKEIVTWRCTSKITKCPAKLFTPKGDKSVILKSVLNHNHSKEKFLLRQSVNNIVRRKAVNERYKEPSKLINQEVASSSTNNLNSYDLGRIIRNVWKTRINSKTTNATTNEVSSSIENSAPAKSNNPDDSLEMKDEPCRLDAVIDNYSHFIKTEQDEIEEEYLNNSSDYEIKLPDIEAEYCSETSNASSSASTSLSLNSKLQSSIVRENKCNNDDIILPTTDDDDEHEIYGRYVTIQLRQMSVENSLEAQAEISAILTKYRLKQFRSD